MKVKINWQYGIIQAGEFKTVRDIETFIRDMKFMGCYGGLVGYEILS